MSRSNCDSAAIQQSSQPLSDVESEPDEPVTDSSDTTVPPELDASAFRNSWGTIPDNSRLDGQLLAKVKTVNSPNGDKKSDILSLTDRLGTEISLDVWKTHDVDIQWREGEWYALSDTRGSAWETDSGTIRKRLSSTKDLTAINLGSEFDPDAIDPGTVEAATNMNESGTGDDVSDLVTSDGTDDEDGIFDEIVSDFEEL